MDNKKLKILLVNHSDARGGASVVTHRLMDALCNEGVDARMLVVHKETGSLRVAEAVSSRRARIPFLAEHLGIYLSNGGNRDTLFKISTARHGLPLHKHPWVKDADVVVLNWINQGMLSLKEIARIGAEKPLIWTMHDQWNMTGVCHYTDGCTSFCEDCRGCSLVGRGRLAEKVFKAKARLYARVPIHFVAVSSTLEALCRTSPLMADADITVIPNALPVKEFGTTPALPRYALKLPENKRLVVMGAARLDDPVKNLPLAIEALNLLGDENICPVFYGDLRNPDILRGLKTPHVWLGKISDAKKLQSVMAHSDVVLSTSVWETLPGTLVEGIACGAVAVATTNGGQCDIIDPGKSGYPVESTPEAVARGLREALALPHDQADRLERHHLMAERFGAAAVARRYIRLARRLLTARQ